ncbi:hypothetical protein J4526_09340 [Desulfurococcaceae archaeon MEX13E-LK6-19]|nr:hypothetical protein J4526_09340 [Desulfurococcaceae archaeon MEX13E-LK6-19]
MQEKSLTTRVLLFLKDYPGASVKDVASYLGININLARAILYRLKNKGIIEKVGNGYILTKSGEYVVGKISTTEQVIQQEQETKQEALVQQKTMQVSKPKEEAITRKDIKDTNNIKAVTHDIKSIEKNLENIEKKITALENELLHLKEELANIRTLIKKIKEKSVERIKTKRHVEEKLPRPVMPVLEAERVLGEKLRSLTYTGKIVIIGSLAVDGEFYQAFLSKFPISRRNAEKLPEDEKILLEEMKKEGKVYLHGGKEYRLV